MASKFTLARIPKFKRNVRQVFEASGAADVRENLYAIVKAPACAQIIHMRGPSRDFWRCITMDNLDGADAIVSGLAQFGLPRAVGNLRTNRFIAWNESFRNQIQYSDKDLRSLALDAVVSLNESEAMPPITGGMVAVVTPCEIKSADGRQIFNGQAAKKGDGFILLMPDPMGRLTSSAEVQRRDRDTERNRLLKFFHDEIAPKLQVAIFEAECAKELLESGDSLALDHVTNVSQMLIEIIDALILSFDEIKPDLQRK